MATETVIPILEQGESKSKTQRRIDKLVRAGHDKDRQIARLEQEVGELKIAVTRALALVQKYRKALQPGQQKPLTPDFSKPQRGDYLNDELYFEALADWKVEQKLKKGKE